MTLGLPTKVENLLEETGLTNVGELAYRLLLVPTSINDIDGIGPTYVEQIESALEVMIGYKPLPEEFDVDEELIIPGITAAKEETTAEDTVEAESPEMEEETTEGDGEDALEDEDISSSETDGEESLEAEEITSEVANEEDPETEDDVELDDDQEQSSDDEEEEVEESSTDDEGEEIDPEEDEPQE
jgi:hypothetical protein